MAEQDEECGCSSKAKKEQAKKLSQISTTNLAEQDEQCSCNCKAKQEAKPGNSNLSQVEVEVDIDVDDADLMNDDDLDLA